MEYSDVGYLKSTPQRRKGRKEGAKKMHCPFAPSLRLRAFAVKLAYAMGNLGRGFAKVLFKALAEVFLVIEPYGVGYFCYV